MPPTPGYARISSDPRGCAGSCDGQREKRRVSAAIPRCMVRLIPIIFLAVTRLEATPRTSSPSCGGETGGRRNLTFARTREEITHGIPASLVKVAPLHPSELENIRLRRSGCRALQSAVMRVPPHRRSLGKDSATERSRFFGATYRRRFLPTFRRR